MTTTCHESTREHKEVCTNLDTGKNWGCKWRRGAYNSISFTIQSTQGIYRHTPFDKLPARALNPRAHWSASSSSWDCPARHLKGAQGSKSSVLCNKQPSLKCVEWGIKAEAHNSTNCLWKSKLWCLQTLKHMYNRVLLLALWLALLAHAGKLLRMYMLGMDECYR